MQGFGRRLVTRSLLLSQIAALGLVSSVASAAVVESGVVNIPVVQNIDGLYLNIVSGANANATLAGWDFNPYFNNAALAFFSSTAAANNNQVTATAATGGAAAPVATGAIVGPASTYQTTGQVITTATVFQTTGTFCIGIRFTNETGGNTLHYGYAVVTTTAGTGFPVTLNRYAWDNTANTPITVNCAATLGGAPQFAYAPASGGTVNFTGGGAIGSTGTGTITVTVGTPGAGTGAANTTTTTCTAPTAPFAGFGQTVTAVGNGAITGSPLSGTCTLGAAAATQTLTCNESRGGTPNARTFQLSCPAGTIAPVTSTPPSGSTVAFGNRPVGSPSTSLVTFNNSAGTPQTVTCTAPAAPFSAAPLSIPVPAGGSASTTVTFTPTATGPATGTLNCTAGATAFTFTLTGTGVPPAVATSVPTLGDAGRWLAILMLLGVGLAAMVVRKH